MNNGLIVQVESSENSQAAHTAHAAYMNKIGAEAFGGINTEKILCEQTNILSKYSALPINNTRVALRQEKRKKK